MSRGIKCYIRIVVLRFNCLSSPLTFWQLKYLSVLLRYNLHINFYNFVIYSPIFNVLVNGFWQMFTVASFFIHFHCSLPKMVGLLMSLLRTCEQNSWGQNCFSHHCVPIPGPDTNETSQIFAEEMSESSWVNENKSMGKTNGIVGCGE